MMKMYFLQVLAAFKLNYGPIQLFLQDQYGSRHFIFSSFFLVLLIQ